MSIEVRWKKPERSLAALGITMVMEPTQCVGCKQNCHPERSEGPFGLLADCAP